MTRTMGSHRAALLVGAAAAAAVTLSGCGAGQIAETVNKDPSIYGVNAQNADGSVLVRNLSVAYGTTAGYQAGASAALELGLYNETTQPVTIQISSRPTAQPTEGVVSARGVNLIGTLPRVTSSAPGPEAVETGGSRPPAQPLPTDSGAGPAGPDTGGATAPTPGGTTPGATPGPGAAGAPARIELGPLDSVIFVPGSSPALQVVGLSGPLRPGNSVNLVFEFSNGAPPLELEAGVAVPLSPAPRGSVRENEGIGEGDHEGGDQN